MTKQQFDDLKVGESIPIKHKTGKLYDLVQIEEINRTKMTIKTMSSDHKSYKCLHRYTHTLKDCKFNFYMGMTMVPGMCAEYHIVEKYQYYVDVKALKKMPKTINW